MSTPAGFAARPPSEIEWEDLLVRYEIGPRALRLALDDGDAGGPARERVCGLLRALCAHADPPLVLKVDNGSAFRSRDLRAWAASVGTRLLYSPPRTPRYDGAIEGSIGALTTRAHHAAVLAGHPGVWTCADIEAARLAANTAMARATQPTALDRWQHVLESGRCRS